MSAAHWFVTGISRGFGNALCEELLARDHRVVGTTRSVSSEMTHKNLTVMPLDVTDEHQTERVFKQAIAKLDRIDLVVNNAGLGMVRAIEEVSTEEAQATLDTNFFGTFNVIRAVVPHFRANRSGHIINFSSVGGITGSAGYGVYNAAKFAVEGLSEALDLELRPFGIKVTIVEPGYFRTEFLSSGSIKKAAKLVDAYADTVGKASNNVSSGGGNQPEIDVALSIVAELPVEVLRGQHYGKLGRAGIGVAHNVFDGDSELIERDGGARSFGQVDHGLLALTDVHLLVG